MIRSNHKYKGHTAWRISSSLSPSSYSCSSASSPAWVGQSSSYPHRWSHTSRSVRSPWLQCFRADTSLTSGQNLNTTRRTFWFTLQYLAFTHWGRWVLGSRGRWAGMIWWGVPQGWSQSDRRTSPQNPPTSHYRKLLRYSPHQASRTSLTHKENENHNRKLF